MEKTKTLKPIVKRHLKKGQLQIAKEIMEITKGYYEQDILTNGRKQIYTLPRQVAQFLINYYCDKLSEQDIATLTGLISHATVRNSIRKIEDYLQFDKEIKTDLIVLHSEITSKVDLRDSSRHLTKRKEIQMNLVKFKMLELNDSNYFDTLDVINNHLNNYN